MGRPYKSELAQLSETYAWGRSADVHALAESLALAVSVPLVSVGSGGSLTSASLAAVLHTQFTGRLARVMTPYELTMSSLELRETAVLLCTAGGSNPDVLACFQGLVRREPRLLASICTRLGSPLSKVAAVHRWTVCHEYATPVRKDGFLATNSLLATMMLLVRAYEQLFGSAPSLPTTLEELLSPGRRLTEYLSDLGTSVEQLCERRTLAVLHGVMTQPAAADIESRFTEAALGNVQLADYRNFAHGRHHWLARNSEETSVLLLSSPEDQDSAERTAALLPRSIPQLHLRFRKGFAGTLSAVLHSIYLGWFAAQARGIDPGRPKVAQFGRKLYHLRAMPKSSSNGVSIPELEAKAIERKSGSSISTLGARNQLDEWRDHYERFRRGLTKTLFHGVIFDYDGTLCGAEERFSRLRKEIVSHLLSLLRAGIRVGIATGRGKSVKEVLRSHIRQRTLQKLVLIGYHNAGEIGSLDDDLTPPTDSPLHDSLQPIDVALAASDFVSRNSRRQAKAEQITLEALSPRLVQTLWDCVSEIVPGHSVPGVRLVRSTHSIDILAPGISKQSLLSSLTDTLRERQRTSSILCIGDQGRLPGNDFDLLQHPHSLSVDQTSLDPSTCWNLSPPGSRLVDACLFYLRHFEIEKAAFRFGHFSEKSA